MPIKFRANGNDKFAHCTGLVLERIGITNLTFCGEEAPQWTETSGEDATLFAPLTAWESVRVPGKSYGKYVRAFASSLPETVRIEVIEATPGAEFYISDGVLYAYLGAGTSAQVPYGVTTIANSAFRENSTLVSITLPDSVTTIDDYAFYGCTGMNVLHWKVSRSRKRYRNWDNMLFTGVPACEGSWLFQPP